LEIWGSYSGVAEYSNILDNNVTSQKIGIIPFQYLMWAGKKGSQQSQVIRVLML